jgi:hypothetical protein
MRFAVFFAAAEGKAVRSAVSEQRKGFQRMP